MPPDQQLTERARATRDNLLAAARATFERDGYDGTSISRIVGDAGVSRGTFYGYFESKEDIFRVLVDALQRRIVDAQTWPGDAPPADILRYATGEFMGFYRENARIMAVLEQAATYDASFRALRRDMRAATARRAARFIRALHERGAAAPTVDPHYAAVALTGMVDRFAYVWFVLNEDFDEDKAIDTLAELWVRAIGCHPAPV